MMDRAHPAPAADNLESHRGTPLERQLKWMIGIRLVVITSVVLPYLLAQIASADEDLGFDFLYLLAGVTYLASLLYIGLLRLLAGRWRVQAVIQFIGDLLLITGMVYYFGGITSPFSILYFVVIIVASALFQRRTGFLVATVACVLYGFTVLALYSGWVSHSGGFSDAEQVTTSLLHSESVSSGNQSDSIPAWRLVYALVTHFFGFYMVAYLTTRLAQTISRTELELQEKRQDLAALQVVHRDVIESIPSGLITCDLYGTVTSVNNAAQEILGKDEATLLNQPITRSGLFSLEQWEELTAESENSRRHRPEVTYRREDSVRHIGYSVTPLADADDRRTGYILIFQDVSDWRRLQEELQLKGRLAAVGELASGIAHEVGNPLAAISGSVQMLTASMKQDAASTRLLDIIFKESQRLDRTIKGFLQFARPRERSNVRFDIAEQLAENLELLRNSPEVSSQHELSALLEPASVKLVADPDQVSQIFWNLARNALRAMPEGGSLEVEGTVQAGHYRIRFIDTGRGMSDAERGTMFHPFRSFFDGGSGIGMAIVYRIVEEHGGHLSVESREGHGTTITVELPLLPTAALAKQVEVET
jgi:two-component system sensor histidine kinase PilS (NtrC family)